MVVGHLRCLFTLAVLLRESRFVLQFWSKVDIEYKVDSLALYILIPVEIYLFFPIKFYFLLRNIYF